MNIADAFNLAELVALEEVDVHVDAFLHGRNVRVDTANVEE